MSVRGRPFSNCGIFLGAYPAGGVAAIQTEAQVEAECIITV